MIYDYEEMHYVCPKCGTVIDDSVTESPSLNTIDGRSVFISGNNFMFTRRRKVVNYNTIITVTEKALSALETRSCIPYDLKSLRTHALYFTERMLVPLLRARRTIDKNTKNDVAEFIAYLLAKQFLIPLCSRPEYRRGPAIRFIMNNIKIPKVRPNPSLLINYIAEKAKNPMKAKKGLAMIANVIAEYAPSIPITEPELTSFFSVLASSATFSQYLEGFECKRNLFDRATMFTIRAIESLKDPSPILGALNKDHKCASQIILFLPENFTRKVARMQYITPVAFEYGLWLRKRRKLPKIEEEVNPVPVLISPPSLAKHIKSRNKVEFASRVLVLGLSELFKQRSADGRRKY